MTQSIRDLLANRRFAIPLIGLLAVCLIGLLLLGVMLVLRPGTRAAASNPTAAATDDQGGRVLPTFTLTTVAQVPTARPTNTLVPIGTVVPNPTAVPTFPPEFGSATVAPTTVIGGQATPGVTATTGAGTVVQPTAAPAPTDAELAQTGVGWGLILASGAGLALVLVLARRLRLAS